MSSYRLELPTIQNWSCHNCGGCCRQHLIELSDEEKARIESQGWTAADAIPSDRPVFVPMGGWLGKKRFRLGHRADGGCVFLNEQGLCRIHAKFGEAAKPLACRIYPFAFHPAGQSVTVSLRFSCPSVVADRGQPVHRQRADLERMARLVVPDDVANRPPPAIHGTEQLDWDDTLRVIAALDAAVCESDVPVMTRLRRAIFWIQLLGQATFDKVRGDRLDELLEILSQASVDEVPENAFDVEPPTAIGRTHFRMLVAQYARRDTSVELERGWGYRWQLLKSAVRFARGTGDAPPLQDAFRPVPFDKLEQPFGDLPDGADELLTRYLECKILGMHFCGPAFYGMPVVDGFLALALFVPATLWLSRWLAAGEGRASLALGDIQQAIALADHHHGYAEALGQTPARRRIRQLVATGDIPRLCAWYSR